MAATTSISPDGEPERAEGAYLNKVSNEPKDTDDTHGDRGAEKRIGHYPILSLKVLRLIQFPNSFS
jgi:hypothetical protein